MTSLTLQLLSKEQLETRLSTIEGKCIKINNRLPSLFEIKKQQEIFIQEKEKHVEEINEVEEVECRKCEDLIIQYEKEMEDLYKQIKTREELIAERRTEMKERETKISISKHELETARNHTTVSEKDIAGVQIILAALTTEINTIKEELDRRNKPMIPVEIDLSEDLRGELEVEIGDILNVNLVSTYTEETPIKSLTNGVTITPQIFTVDPSPIVIETTPISKKRKVTSSSSSSSGEEEELSSMENRKPIARTKQVRRQATDDISGTTRRDALGRKRRKKL